MSAISLKSISGITSITTPAGVDDQLTLHNNNSTEAVKLDIAGNLHFHNHLNITGVSTASNFKTGTSNLHNTGLNVQDLDVDGHTELDNVNIVGVTTHNGQTKLYGNGGASAIWGNTGYSGHLSFDGSNNAVIRAATGKALIFQTDHVNTRMTIGSQGNVSIEKDLDVDGHTNLDNVSIAGVTTMTGNLSMGETLTVSGNNPNLTFTDTNSNPDFKIYGSNGSFSILDSTNGVNRFVINSVGNISISNDLDVDGHTNLDNVNVSGATTCNGQTDFLNSINLNASTNNYIYFNDNLNFTRNGHGNEMRISPSGQLLLGAGAITTPKVSQSGSLDLDSGGISLCIGGDENSSGRTNSTNKLNRIVTPHYANAEEPMAMFSGYSSQNASELFYGGGSSSTNAVTRHSFYTASNSTTTTGTERIRVVSNGQIIVGEANTAPVSDFEIRRANSGGDVSLRIGNNSGTNSGTTASLYFTTSPSQTFNTSYIQAVRDGGKLNFGYSTNTPIVTMHVSQGKVGINATSPVSILDVRQSVTTQSETDKRIAVFYKQGTAVGDEGYIHLTTMTGHYGVKLGYRNEGASPGYLNQGFYISTVNNAENITNHQKRFVIKSNGNIGINQTDPSRARLHVVGPSSSGTEIVAKFKGASGADARAKIGLAAAYSDTANDTEGQAYVGALRNGSGNSSQLFFEISHGNTLKELARVDNNGINVGGSYRFNNGARDSATMPNTHNIGDVSSNTISYQHNAGFYYVYATIPTDGNWYDMFTSFNDSACNFRGVCGDASSKNSFYWYFNPTSPSYGVNPYGEKWHHGAWNTGSVTFRLDGSHPNWNLQIKCTSYYGTNRTASLRAIMEVYY